MAGQGAWLASPSEGFKQSSAAELSTLPGPGFHSQDSKRKGKEDSLSASETDGLCRPPSSFGTVHNSASVQSTVPTSNFSQTGNFCGIPNSKKQLPHTVHLGHMATSLVQSLPPSHDQVTGLIPTPAPHSTALVTDTGANT